jgi:hypothetical protein
MRKKWDWSSLRKKNKHRRLWLHSKKRVRKPLRLPRMTPIQMTQTSTEKRSPKAYNRKRISSLRSMRLAPTNRLKSNKKAMQWLKATQWCLCLGAREMQIPTRMERCTT